MYVFQISAKLTQTTTRRDRSVGSMTVGLCAELHAFVNSDSKVHGRDLYVHCLCDVKYHSQAVVLTYQ